MQNWTIEELNKWNDKIEILAKKLGLDFFEQEYEICNYHDMIGYQSYVGMPSRYPHWSFGKSFEKQQTTYKLGVSGLAYEMVINSDPCLAYLMIDNPLSMQILVMAHVYGHNDFFKNNSNFSKTRPELALEMFKRHSTRVRTYIEDPSIGIDKVERILDAAHAISFQCQRNIFINRQSVQEQKEDHFNKLRAEKDKWDHLSPKENNDDAKFEKKEEEDLLLFIRDNNPFLEEWEKDLLTIVREETLYFIPQMETKIMNEGWASFWHFTMLNRLNLPAEIHIDFLRSHNQVIRPHVGGLNPYHIGYSIFTKLAGSDGHTIDYDINPEIFEIRKIDRDSSFLRRFLTQELAEELHLFEYLNKDGRTTITATSDSEKWTNVRETLIKNTGINSIPFIKIKDVNPFNRSLELVHSYDGRELEMAYTEKTLQHVAELWGTMVSIDTTLNGKPITCYYNNEKFEIKEKGGPVNSKE